MRRPSSTPDGGRRRSGATTEETGGSANGADRASGTETDDAASVPGRTAATGRSRSRRAILAGVASVAGAGLAASAGSAGAQSDRSIRVAVADLEIDGGETTEVGLTLTSVPEVGIYGATLRLQLDGEVAAFTGEGRWDDDWALKFVDPDDDDPSAATVTMTNTAPGTFAGQENLNLGYVEVTGVGSGQTTVDVTVDSLQDANEDQIPVEVGSATLSVAGEGEFEPDDSSKNGTTEIDIDDVDDDTVGDGTAGDDGSGGDGSSGDGTSGDDGGGDDGSLADGSFDDGGAGDSTPGFGMAATAVALLAGFGAKLHSADQADDDSLE